MSHGCVSLIDTEDWPNSYQYQHTGHVARMGENRIPNRILHGEIKEGCHKQGILTQEKFQRRAQEQPTQV